MNQKRKQVSPKTRFEVFKRDSFTCSYCGNNPPSVILHVDHIKPVVKGGTNDLINLVTSCITCNMGKGPRNLDDTTTVRMVQNQAELLNEKRLQMEMMFQWHQELKELDKVQIEKISAYWLSNVPGVSITPHGKKTLAKLLKKYGLPALLLAIDTAAQQYVKFDNNGGINSDSAAEAFKKIGGILKVEKLCETKPYLKDLFYIRGILRKRIYVNEDYVMELLESAVQAGVAIENLSAFAKKCRNWTQFQEEIEKITSTTKEAPALPKNEASNSNKVELDTRTTLIGESVDLVMTLLEDFDLDEEQANQFSDSLGFMCEEFNGFLRESNPEKSLQGAMKTLLSFITEKDWDQAHIPPQYRSGYEWNFSSLNRLLGNSCEWDIPFIYFSRFSKINKLTFPTLEMYREFVNSLNIPLSSSISFLEHVQQPKTYPFETASILQKGITAALLKEFEICGVPEYGKEVESLIRFFSVACSAPPKSSHL